MDVSPPPTDEELAAIVTACHVLWPRPAAPAPATVAATDVRWRFSGRWWIGTPMRGAPGR